MLNRLLGMEDSQARWTSSSSNLVITPATEDALLHAEASIIASAKAAEEQDVMSTTTSAEPKLVLFADAAEAGQRLHADLAQVGARLVRAVLVGQWPYGVTLDIRADGHPLQHGSPITTPTLDPMPMLSAARCTEVLDKFAINIRTASVGVPTVSPEEPSAEPPAASKEAAPERLLPSVSVHQSATTAIARIGRMVIEGPAATVGFPRRTDAFHMLVLLSEHRQGLQRGTAYDLLWPEADPTIDRERFHGPLRELRGKLCRALGRPTSSGKIVIQRLASGYRLNPDLVTTDLWQIHDALTRAATATDPTTRHAALQAAVAAYTGPILNGSPYSWAETAARDLDQKITKALMQLADLETEPDAAITHLAAAIDIDPYAEHLYRAQMKLLAQHGRAAEIHKTYERLCEVLRALDTALRPASQTSDLYRRLTSTITPARPRPLKGLQNQERSRRHPA
ncbi:BTAD domain-containing putative transcriptional regulator [Actinomadura sp. NPDC047616]|uniref:AfsR/SARP family transcriptional regulator n=1 Tax=Actinomadura sp. NPDC047616 TaxID=3155914 RepID=UPI0033FD1E3D